MKLHLFALILLFSTTAFANFLGNMQTFSPTPDSLYFENVQSSKTLARNHFNVGGYFAFVRNELSVYDNMTTQNYNKYKDTAWTFDFIAAWGVTDSLELFYSLPMFIDQQPDSGQYQNNYITKGANSHRPGIKYDISQSKDGGFAIIGSVDFPVTENDPYTGTDASPIYNLEGVYDIRGTVSAFALNVGYRFREPGNLPTNPYFFPLQDQFIYSLGFVTALNTNHRFHAELFGAMAADKEPHNQSKHVSALEGLLAYKQRLLKGLWGHVGATGEILPEGLAPQFRVYAGLNYFFGLKGSSPAPKTETPSSELMVAPDEVSLKPQGEQAIEVSGGEAPYKYRLTRNFGKFDESNLTYYAPNKPGRTELVVEDTKGNKKFIPIMVAREAVPLQLEPAQIEMFEGEAKTITANGGQTPITYELTKPFGEFSETDMTYQAPTQPGEVDLIAKDDLGTTSIVHIVVKEVPKATREFVIQNLQFKYNSDELISSSKKILESNISKLQNEKIKKIIVVGHTDDKGKDQYNLKLSRLRAQTVANDLIQRLNLNSQQVQAIGRGESSPIATNKTEAGRQKNRRVELKLYY